MFKGSFEIDLIGERIVILFSNIIETEMVFVWTIDFTFLHKLLETKMRQKPFEKKKNWKLNYFCTKEYFSHC